ncbi:zinc-dependent metalloprotease [Oerskovia enterophila]|uniref:zinc-dependent metalloprotease n=1 Tax=Oerskovia enterophila TaxID=43678 RepID=UPI003806BC78
MTSPVLGTPLVDWSAAAQIAGRVARPGPLASRDELAELVAGLRAAASDAVPHVLRVTRMVPAALPGSAAAPGGVASEEPGELSQVFVVDRPRWARANTEVMASLTDGVADALTGKDDKPVSVTTALVGAAQVGAVLAALSSRVLGQFDPYSAAGGSGLSAAGGSAESAAGGRPDGGAPPGRLLLVAPNVLQLERDLDLVPADFRLWVCLHEQTHALQFAAAPWLADHLRARAHDLLVGLSESSRHLADARLREKVATAGRVVVRAVRGEGGGVAEGLLTPDQKAVLEEVSGVMALLEGHADVMMDAVGRRTVPTVRRIRARFEARRDGQGSSTLDTVLRRFLGMDAKLAQYRDGAAFVRAVERQVGRDGLNAVWTSPGTLPSAREIAEPGAWVRRVHG